MASITRLIRSGGWLIWATWLKQAAQELSRYLLYLRVPLLLLGLAVVAFLTQQLSDVLLGMALEPEWGAFVMGALAAGLFGVALWLSARTLSERRWMALKPSADSLDPSGSVEAEPLVDSMPAAVVWWLPRMLGMAPMLLMAGVLLWRVGAIGEGAWMALLLILEALALLWLLYARTRVPQWLEEHARRIRRIPLAVPLLTLVNRRALTVRSGNRSGLFSARFKLVLMTAAWMLLALISVPIARAAYGPFGGGSLHLYGVLLGGAGVLALDRLVDRDDDEEDSKPRQFWLSFGLLLLSALLVPLLINATDLSGVAIPRFLGSIAILYLSLAIFTVFASSFFLFASQSGIPLVSLLLVVALLLASFRVNDNHAVRLLPGQGSSTLPSLSQSFNAWLDRDGRRAAIQASASPWPIYVVSAQGGGVYAAYHSAKALALLSQEVPAFPEHLFALSGVSGGSVGSTAYLNALNQATAAEGIVERIDASFDQDQLSTVLAAMLFQDATQRFYPWPVHAWDRALGLELSFSTGGSRKPAPVSLEGSFYGDQKGPFLVLNTTEVESGRRLLLSPFQFDSDSTFHVPDAQDVRFSTAAVMSARFPLITPYAFFDGSPEQRQRRTVDGGYYDNSGAVTAEEIVTALNTVIKKDERLWSKVRVIPIAIVGISSFEASPADDASRPSVPVASVGQKPLLSFSAIDALFAARDARVSKALSDYGIRCGTKKEGDQGLCITLQTAYKLRSQSADVAAVRQIPLGWTLSCQSRAFISQQLAVTDSPGPPNLACLRRQDASLQLEAAGPVAGQGNIPSFAAIVKTVRGQVESAARGTGSPA